MSRETEVSRQSLDLLDARLRRLNFVLAGDTNAIEPDPDSRHTAAARLRVLERQLDNLSAKSQTAAQVLHLHQRKPFVFHAASNPSLSQELAPTSLASLVLAHSQTYHRLSQQLSGLSNLNIPDPTKLVSLVDLQSRIDKAESKHSDLAHQTAVLRSRSAQLLESWYQAGVLQMSEQWTHWEECLRDVEILVRRMEAAKKREDDLL